ncbi:MAG: protein-L-isoaspartate(D-aspartate) O-methyltransferase [Candidatus Parabeggiatoa sp. nov. 3]|nr:MAG: protein-L-isoaspartate(D-aspartate) O-methyltransferase [Gammaproteobacteria bacterium]RKZ87829.1 MAG: protein-L-isoaspartate(D-aspartate) O-methyltransferase [Gammaproteobacteria bacterium]
MATDNLFKYEKRELEAFGFSRQNLRHSSKSPSERLIEELRTQGIVNAKVLDIMRTTPRHLFIDEALSSHAYANYPLPIGYGQTISQPYIVARMTEALLNQGKLDNVLEVGTGCGYQTAILAQLVGKVYSVERIKTLSDKARDRLNFLGLNNVQLQHSDGHWGWAEQAPYQGIIVTAAPLNVPEALLEQLALGGCLIIPVGQKNEQILLQIIRTRTQYEQYLLGPVNFVPLHKGLK